MPKTVSNNFKPADIGNSDIPICERCAKAGLYCDHTSFRLRPSKYIKNVSKSIRDPFKSLPRLNLADPAQALQHELIANLLQHYTRHLAPWYDLNDYHQQFRRAVPVRVLSSPLLLNAVLAFAAMHLSRTSRPGFRSDAESFHHECLARLICLNDGDADLTDGTALASTCLLRSYEILAEDADPNRHLFGASSLIHDQDQVLSSRSLLQAGFWNFLREDITYSLIQQRPLKLDVLPQTIPIEHDEDYANSVTLLLAYCINTIFGYQASPQRMTGLSERLRIWKHSLPPSFTSFTVNTSGAMPCIRMLQDTHYAAMQYYHTARLLVHSASSNTTSSPTILEDLAVQISSLAFSSHSPSVMVNSYGPICFTGRWISQSQMRREVVSHLQASKPSTGWPVDQIIQQLKTAWRSEAAQIGSPRRRARAQLPSVEVMHGIDSIPTSNASGKPRRSKLTSDNIHTAKVTEEWDEVEGVAESEAETP